jgi:uncharacterized protein (TIGR03437 family)
MPRGVALPLACASLLLLTGNELVARDYTVCPAQGESKVAVLLLDFPFIAFPTTWYTSDEWRTMFFSSSPPSMTSFFTEVSYGKTQLKGDVFGPIHLSKTYQYAVTSERVDALKEAIGIVGKTADMREYDRFVVLMPVNSGSGGNGGGDCMPWEAPTGYFSARVVFLGIDIRAKPSVSALLYLINHEMGHNLGPHHATFLGFGANTVGPPGALGNFVDYGDPYSVMGSGTLESVSELIGHFSARHRLVAGWLNMGTHIQDVQQGAQFRLEPIESDPPGLKALRIRRLPASDQWFWVEYRQPLGYDADLARYTSKVFGGVLVQYEDSMQPSTGGTKVQTLLLDMHPETPGTLKDAALESGAIWSDPFGPVTIQVANAGTGGVDVTVRYDESCATVDKTSRTVPATGGSGTIDVKASGTCQWKASVYGSFVSINGSASGSGSATLTFSVPQNTTNLPRTAWITIDRQSVPITQDFVRLAPAVKSITPSSGMGAILADVWRTFDTVFTDPNGAADLRRLQVLFSTDQLTSAACYVDFDVIQKSFRLAGDSGADWIEPGSAGQESGFLGNSQCRIRTTAAAEALNDVDYNLILNVEFKSGFVGQKTVYLRAEDASGLSSGWQAMGTWKPFINVQPSVVSVSPASGTGLSQTFRLTARDANGADDIYQVSLTVARSGDTQVCAVLVDLKNSRVSLLKDDLTWMQMVSTKSAVVLQSSYCGIEASRVSWTSAGNDAVVDIPVVFIPGFSGTKDVTGAARDFAASTLYRTVTGKWIIPADACQFALNPAEAQVGPNRATGTFLVTNGADCTWLLTSDSTWLSISPPITRTGTATITYTADFNLTTSSRSGVIRMSGVPFKVTQAGREVALGVPLLAASYPMYGPNPWSGLGSGSWLTLRGTNLSPSTRVWGPEDFAAGKLPTQLDGVSVTVNGKPGYLYYVSPAQLNVLMPDFDVEEPLALRISTPAGTLTSTSTAVVRKYAPAFFMFDAENSKYVAGVHPDGTLLGKPALYPGLNLRPAKPGGAVQLYGCGFGPSDPPRPTSDVVIAPAPMASPVTVLVDFYVKAKVLWAGIVGSGLVQINIEVPELSDGDHILVAEINGVRTTGSVYFTVSRSN